MRSLLVVEGEELVESSEPPAVLIVGLKEPFDLAVRLSPSNLAQRVFNVMIVEVLFEFPCGRLHQRTPAQTVPTDAAVPACLDSRSRVQPPPE